MTMRIIRKFHRRLQIHFFFILCLCAGTDPNISFQKIMTNLREIIYIAKYSGIFTTSQLYIYKYY